MTKQCIRPTTATAILICVVLSLLQSRVTALNVVIAGGTGEVGRALSAKLASEGHSVTILCRNSFLASAPARVSSDFGWLGQHFLSKYPTIKLRDWDGGDLLDIVGQDWVGWQDDALPQADALINLCGGFTEQRVLASERLVGESLRLNPTILQVTVSPKDEEMKLIAPLVYRPVAIPRLKTCEDLVKNNCPNFELMRLEANMIEFEAERIKQTVYKRLGH